MRNLLQKACIPLIFMLIAPAVMLAAGGGSGHAPAEGVTVLPPSLEDYVAYEKSHEIEGLVSILKHRIQDNPFNLIATLIFFCAIIHTFMASKFQHWAHVVEEKHMREAEEQGRTADAKPYHNAKDDTSFSATALHFLGEVEAIFGIWCIPLVGAITYFFGWGSATHYIDNVVNYTEPMFVVVIMAIASTRPVLKFSEIVLGKVADLGGRSPKAWWYSILIIAPLLGSFITEPAAMTISALLLAKTIYVLDPSPKFKYGTLGLLFVNISVGGTLTHFAAPPVLMVAGKWGWDMPFMFMNFGWKAFIGILIATAAYGFALRGEFKWLKEKADERAKSMQGAVEEPIPIWITAVVLIFMAWTVFNLHNPPLFIAGFLFFLAFVTATATHQDDVSVKGPILVGFFLAGLVTHGPLQQWWIAPVLGQLGELSLFTGSTILTAFNDNAAITFLASQVPEFDASFGEIAINKQYAVVAGAVTGGGLTVIANAPNPAGQSLLSRYFGEGVNPGKLFLGALFPTIVMAFCFMLIR
ncbi:MAG: putative Na+/H+ antiporter [Puniceicoccaceae bacterium]